MERDPFAGDLQRLKDQPAVFRRRIGDWRIFFDAHSQQRLLVVTDIVRRTTTTYRKRH